MYYKILWLVNTTQYSTVQPSYSIRDLSLLKFAVPISDIHSNTVVEKYRNSVFGLYTTLKNILCILNTVIEFYNICVQTRHAVEKCENDRHLAFHEQFFILMF